MSIKKSGIPISVSLSSTLESEAIYPQQVKNKKRLLMISCYAIAVGAAISLIARFLVYLINLITNLSFYQSLSIHEVSPAHNRLGWIVVAIPALGGIIVGLMAKYGSKAIRGHGIPEAMEQILTNESKIRPTITYLKPISSAIAIGTGGPFGAEGPIIATGGALGSTLGQLLRITHTERKILLSAGAVAGMTAIFGTPVAAIFLAIELLLFEFTPRSIIPVALACITGAAGHHLLFSAVPVFFSDAHIGVVSNMSIFFYSLMGLLIGFLAILVTKSVYAVEDLFEKLPVHWVWWPAIGGIAVGLIGYFFPRTLGVGYENITDLLSGKMPLYFVLTLCVFKYLSWVLALGSGTSGGTLAPLLTIGAALGVLIATAFQQLMPDLEISLALAALIGMSAMFAGASRALLTSILFALETTGHFNALIPLLAACVASYMISYLFMRNTIMTEKISRRGILTPDEYEPNLLEMINVGQIMQQVDVTVVDTISIAEVQDWIGQSVNKPDHLIIVNEEQQYAGLIATKEIYTFTGDNTKQVGSLIENSVRPLYTDNSLRIALNVMLAENKHCLPVIDKKREISGIITYDRLLNSFQEISARSERRTINISLRRRGLKFISNRKRSNRV
ncbi:chloride channel protein [Olivibacter sp. CPCC 100613]|uniref:chloride channel protein n=1 Tax=Olivibacter sp. CPCC 100613 TaxID=3079931 RepID=UPI002FF77778